ncbi:predicted protein, partial [Haematococcus lacustris]
MSWSRQQWTRKQHRNVWPHVTLEQVEVMKEVFGILDGDGKGYFTASELGSVMRAMGGAPSAAELEGVMRELDADGDRCCTFP